MKLKTKIVCHKFQPTARKFIKKNERRGLFKKANLKMNLLVLLLPRMPTLPSPPTAPSPPTLPIPPTLPTLPQEVWSRIASNLSVIDKIAVSTVSRRHRAAVRDPLAWSNIAGLFWQDVVEDEPNRLVLLQTWFRNNQKWFQPLHFEDGRQSIRSVSNVFIVSKRHETRRKSESFKVPARCESSKC